MAKKKPQQTYADLNKEVYNVPRPEGAGSRGQIVKEGYSAKETILRGLDKAALSVYRLERGSYDWLKRHLRIKK